MTKDEILKKIDKVLSAEELMLVKINKSIQNNDFKHIENIGNPYEEFVNFLKLKENRMDELLGSFLYDQILSYTNQSYLELQKIIDIFFEESGFFKKKKGKKLTSIELEKTKSHYDDLKAINKKFAEYISSSIQRLNSLSKDKFENKKEE